MSSWEAESTTDRLVSSCSRWCQRERTGAGNAHFIGYINKAKEGRKQGIVPLRQAAMTATARPGGKTKKTPHNTIYTGEQWHLGPLRHYRPLKRAYFVYDVRTRPFIFPPKQSSRPVFESGCCKEYGQALRRSRLLWHKRRHSSSNGWPSPPFFPIPSVSRSGHGWATGPAQTAADRHALLLRVDQPNCRAHVRSPRPRPSPQTPTTPCSGSSRWWPAPRFRGSGARSRPSTHRAPDLGDSFCVCTTLSSEQHEFNDCSTFPQVQCDATSIQCATHGGAIIRRSCLLGAKKHMALLLYNNLFHFRCKERQYIQKSPTQPHAAGNRGSYSS